MSTKPIERTHPERTQPEWTQFERAQLQEAARWVGGAKKCIAFSGAGVSTESGIPDFRSADGLWSRFDPQEYGTIGAFRQNPAKVWEMLSSLNEVLDAEPNAGHRALASLEEAGLLAGIVTQNIDGLHQKAGSRRVVEFHGSDSSYLCLRCGAEYARARVQPLTFPPRCDQLGGACDQLLKPNVIFFDEPIPRRALLETEALLFGCDLCLVLGTSCEVYPASSIPERVRQQGGRVIELNKEPVRDLAADLTLTGSFAEWMPLLTEAAKRAPARG